MEVSVIVPCYNSRETIIDTLLSLENQTFRNFEVIIVNDGSNDDSDEVINNYINKNSKLKIIYLKQTNKGVSSARNYALENATSKYITFLDADDVYHPQYLEILYELIEEKNVDIVCCKYKMIDNKKQLDYRDQYVRNALSLTKEQFIDKYMHKRITKIGFWGAIYKRELISKHRVIFPPFIKYGEDSEFFCKYLAHCEKGGLDIENELYGYKNQPNSAMHSDCTWKMTDNIIAMQNVVKYWKEKGLSADFEEYMITRAIWGVTKDFARADKDLFIKLGVVYDVKGSMKFMAKYGDEMLIRLSALFYILNTELFRRVVKMF
jgi:glycosyltransferase involved in cell wall biosynthesis